MIEQIVVWALIAVLGISAMLSLLRMVRGPSIVDRAVANEVLMGVMICALGVEAAVTRHDTTLPILISLSLVGFLSSVAVARFVGGDAAPAPPRLSDSDGGSDVSGADGFGGSGTLAGSGTSGSSDTAAGVDAAGGSDATSVATAGPATVEDHGPDGTRNGGRPLQTPPAETDRRMR